MESAINVIADCFASPIRRVATALLAVVLVTPAVASADSDGYFCIGTGYLAYETRFATPGGPHLLHVVRFGRDIGIVESQPVLLEDFQVHQMTCAPEVVYLEAHDRGYSVNLTTSTVVKRAARLALRPGASPNLGHWAQNEAIVPLPVAGGGDDYQLVIARTSRRVRGGIERYTIALLVQRTSGERSHLQNGIITSLKLFEGVILETGN